MAQSWDTSPDLLALNYYQKSPEATRPVDVSRGVFTSLFPTNLVLLESLTTTNNEVFIRYLDLSKAFRSLLVFLGFVHQLIMLGQSFPASTWLLLCHSLHFEISLFWLR